MISKRDFIQLAGATAALIPAGWSRAFAQQRLTQDELLKFEPLGNVTLVHVTDLHGQLLPVLFREPSINLGVGPAKGLVPHLTGRALLDLYKIPAGSAAAYALSSEDFATLAKSYGRIGGLDRIATILKAIRAERGERVMFLDGGDTWQNSYTSLQSKGQDMVDCMALLKPDAMTGHWEFTLGEARVKQLVENLGFPFLAQNIRDTEWNEPAFKPFVDHRTRRRSGGDHWAGSALYGDREPTLDDSQLVVWDSRRRSAKAGRTGPERRRAACCAPLAQRFRRRS